MRHTLLAALAVLAITACASDGTATVTTAPPSTTVATTAPATTPATATQPTTTAPTTTTKAPPTTAAPTVAPPAGPEVSVPPTAEAEVVATVDAFWSEVDGCFAAPEKCDIDTVVSTYTTGSPVIAMWFTEWIAELRAQGQHADGFDRDERMLRSISVDTNGFATTSQCTISRARIVQTDGGNTSVIDDTVGYGRYDFQWTKHDGRWVIASSAQMSLEGNGDGGCEF